MSELDEELVTQITEAEQSGVPGRHEIDDTQELNYPCVCRAIVDAGFTGYLAHEFLPPHDPMTFLQQAVQLCDV